MPRNLNLRNWQASSEIPENGEELDGALPNKQQKSVRRECRSSPNVGRCSTPRIREIPVGPCSSDKIVNMKETSFSGQAETALLRAKTYKLKGTLGIPRKIQVSN